MGGMAGPFMLASGSTCHTSAHPFPGTLNQDVEPSVSPKSEAWSIGVVSRDLGYLAVFVLSFISAMGLPVGAEVAIIFGGVLASGTPTTAPSSQSGSVIVVAILAEVAGSLAGYLIGYFGGRTLVDRLGKYVLLTHRDLDRAEAWFARRGDPFVLFGRFIPLLRSFVSFAAGSEKWPSPKFLLFTVIGCAVWCTALTSLGYSLGGTYHHVLKASATPGILPLPFSSSPWWHSFSTDSGCCVRSDSRAEPPEPSRPGLMELVRSARLPWKGRVDPSRRGRYELIPALSKPSDRHCGAGPSARHRRHRAAVSVELCGPRVGPRPRRGHRRGCCRGQPGAGFVATVSATVWFDFSSHVRTRDLPSRIDRTSRRRSASSSWDS